MIHPDTELRFINAEVGYGVVATRDIPKGTITWVQDRLDRELSPEEAQELGPAYQEILEKYCFRNQYGAMVLCWDHARFVNHSFNSNCLTTAYNFELAVRDIRAGEELTDDYGYLNIERPFRAIDEGHRRKIVYPDDLTRYAPMWDKKLQAAFKRLHQVTQPLKVIMELESWETATRVAAGAEPMRSIRHCHYAPAVWPRPSGRNGTSRRTADGRNGSNGICEGDRSVTLHRDSIEDRESVRETTRAGNRGNGQARQSTNGRG